MKAVFCSIQLLIASFGVEACSCIDVGLSGQFASATHVFEAVALGSRIVMTGDSTSDPMREMTLLVGHTYKGQIPRKVVVRTRTHGVFCGALLPFGGRYLVFTSAVGDGTDHVLFSSSCSGNRHYPFWRFGLRRNVRRLARGEKIPATTKWARVPSW